MTPEVTEYIQGLQDWQIEIAEKLRALVYQAIPDATERLQYKKPHFLKGKTYAAVITPAKEYVSFTLFNAASLQVPEGLFEDGPAERRTIKIRKGHTADYALLEQLLKDASSTIA